jgi:hypothetical protein
MIDNDSWQDEPDLERLAEHHDRKAVLFYWLSLAAVTVAFLVLLSILLDLSWKRLKKMTTGTVITKHDDQRTVESWQLAIQIELVQETKKYLKTIFADQTKRYHL